ncbi:TPA: hypothetical protein ACXPP1_004578, partial [Salmonella enterica]|nr:DUF2345 domain-containing protein [Salmonella enterica subsp. houtenae]
DLARKVSGALGIKVEGDIVLESSSRISLKAGGSFISIHAGGVDIMGPKINLNSGGSAGTSVETLQVEMITQYFDRKLRFSSDVNYRVETTEGEELFSGSGTSGYIDKADCESEYWVFVS